MNKSWKKYAVLAMIVILSLTLSGCGGKDVLPEENASVTASPTDAVVFAEMISENTDLQNNNGTPVFSPSEPVAAIVDGLTDEQRNSIGMLNYITMFTQEINSSKNNRLYLETAYSTLVDNTHPNAVNQDTHYQLMEILDRLEEYRLIAVKRERLEYIYEQNKAQAIRSAVPNPLGLLSAVGSFSWAKLAASVAYMAVDSVTSYKNASSQADLKYLQDGWELDDAEAATLHKMRSNAFSYMLDMVNTYSLPGDLALNETAIANFVNWKMDGNVVRRVQLLEAHNDTYQGFGPYWLTLADSYYQNGDYQKCLNAIASYESLSTRIFRKDYELANVLSVALLSAMKTKSGDEYTAVACYYLELIEKNAADDNWSLRYFAAQGYIDLYQRTGNDEYLNKAYAIVVNNVSLLVREQLKANETYLSDLQKIAIPDGATDEKEEEIKNLNKQAEEERKTALAPVSESLVLNCDLLFALAEKLQIPADERLRIENILHDDSQALFLVAPIDDLYWFEQRNVISSSDLTVEFDGEVLKVPATILSEDSSIMLTVTSDKETMQFCDWKVSKVDRKESGKISSFVVSLTSQSLSSFDFEKGMTVTISITAKEDSAVTPYTFEFSVSQERTLGIFPYSVYTRTK